jgi:hypothetical protein
LIASVETRKVGVMMLARTRLILVCSRIKP